MTSEHVSYALYFLVALIIFFAPAWAARAGKRWAIFFVVLFFGWTGIGWGVAVIMSARSRESVK